MKKRIISLLLCFSILFGFAVPAMTPQADAFIGSLISTGLQMSTSIIKSCVEVCNNVDSYDNAGQAVGAMFKGAAQDFLGIGGSGGTTVINQVDLSLVEESLGAINEELTSTKSSIYQLESTVTQGIQDLSKQMDQIDEKLDEIKAQLEQQGQQMTDSTKLLRYNTYLNTFFEFFNQYYEALSYYDRQMNDMLANGSYTDSAKKNIYDRFYQLQDVEYTGSFHSAVDKLGRYLQGTYLNSSPGSIVDVLSQYYITSYTLMKNNGATEITDPMAKAANDTEEMIGYIYYAYVMGAYYEQAIAMYQTASMSENGDDYKTDFNTILTQDSIDSAMSALWSSMQTTAGCMIRDLINNYPTTGSMPVVYQLSTGEVLNRSISSDLFNGAKNGTVFHVEADSVLNLQDPVAALSGFSSEDESSDTYSGYFSKKFSNSFMGLASYQSGDAVDAVGSTTVCLRSTTDETQVVEAELGGVTVFSVTVMPYSSTVFYAGDGTEEYPYLIKTVPNSTRDCANAADQLARIFGYTNMGYGYEKSCFVLGQDVDLENRKMYGLASFSGVFDGNGFTISNFELHPIQRGSNLATEIGLFSYLTGTVRNLQLKNGTFEVTTDGSGASAHSFGIIAGNVNGGTVEYCRVDSSTVSIEITSSDESERRSLFAGGAVGSVTYGGKLDAVVVADTKVSAITAAPYPTPQAYGIAVAGGVVGFAVESATITRCSYSQSHSASTDTAICAKSPNFLAYAGSLIGWNNDALKSNDISHCWVLAKADPATETSVSSPNKTLAIGGSYDTTPDIAYLKWDDATSSTIQEISESSLKTYWDDQTIDLSPFTFGESDQKNLTYLDFRTKLEGAVTSPIKRAYNQGDYLDLTGFKVYQTVGACKLDTEYRYATLCTKDEQGSTQAYSLTTPLTLSQTLSFDYSTGQDAGSIVAEISVTLNECNHIYIAKVTTAATCTSAGTRIYTCIRCGDVLKTETIPALGHNLETTLEAKAATCTEGGWEATVYCSRCRHLFLGLNTDPTGHTPVTVEGYPATCTEPGLTDGEICSVCGETITEQTVIPSLDHQTEITTVLEPSCVSGGVKQEKCTVCGEIIKLENIAPLGHDYQSAVTAPTCENPGYTTHTCVRCGDSYTDSYTAPTQHHYGDGVVTREPTCTEAGEMTYTCTCGNTHTEPIPTADHDYVPIVTEPTCTEMGYTTHTCTQCGESYVDTYTVPNGHSWDEGETVTPPTLIATGLLHQSCTICGEDQETVIPALTSCDGGLDCPSRKFKDVQGVEHWSHIGIDYVLRNSIFYGVSNDEFRPNTPMTRAMLVTVLYRMEGSPSVSGLSHSFEDVRAGAWYEDALIWASNSGVVNGVTASRFDPNSNVTREQTAAILYRYANLQGYDTTAAADLSNFKDSDDVGKFAREAIAWANATGLVQGYTDGTLHPKESATRAQLAAILMRFMKNVAK